MNITKRIATIPAQVSGMSLIGVGPNRPCSWGNYFWFASGLRCLNFWAENLVSACEKFLTDGMVQVHIWEWEEAHWKEPTQMVRRSVCVVDDPRIPEDWYYNKLCFTGHGRPPVEVANQIYALLGDPTNQLEQFTDPVSYHAKRGGTYHSNGVVSYGPRPNASDTTLDGAYAATIQVGAVLTDAAVAIQPVSGVYYAPHTPNLKG